jgi:alpha-galactosidase
MHLNKKGEKSMRNLKIALIGAGSISFALGTLNDIILSKRLQKDVKLEVALMDIVEEHVIRTYQYAEQMVEAFESNTKVWWTTDLHKAVEGCEFVITAIEVERYKYWSQDFHIPRQFGSKQVYGENGGPGSMFHTLRNLPPMLEIAYAMEKLCPNAWLINFTNPEAKLVEAITKLTKIKAVGLCHGLDMGIHQIAEFLEMDPKDIEVEGGGLNHFGFFTKIWDKRTGEDLYPLFKIKESKVNRLAQFDHIGLSRTMYHIYGYYPYPGTNHCGEYVSYADDFYAGLSLQFRYEPVKEALWEKDSREAEFVYCASGDQLDRKLVEESGSNSDWITEAFRFNKENVQSSNEYAIPIVEAIYFDDEIQLNAVNMQNNGAIAGLPDDMVVETQAVVNGKGITLKKMEVALPTAILGTIHIQGTIHKLLIEAYLEKSKTKLLQAILLDPQAPSYYQACAMIDKMCELQEEILPELTWK